MKKETIYHAAKCCDLRNSIVVSSKEPVPASPGQTPPQAADDAYGARLV
jgi:hypothetical protein